MRNGSSGRANAHTHLYSGLAPLGIPRPPGEPRTFLERLEGVWWRLDRALDRDSLRAAARLYCAEALLEGTTVVVDHHESPCFVDGSLDVLADAAQELGLRAVLCYGATERNGGREEAQRGLAECRRFLEANDRPLVSGVVGLHAAFTCSDETLEQAGALARELGTVVHVHVAEAPEDEEDARRRGYAGVLARLLDRDALPPGSILAHGVGLSSEDVQTCSDRGLWIVQNPRSNLANRVGYPEALGASERVALGTDGFPADMIDEAEVLVLQAGAHGEDWRRAAARVDAGLELVAECAPALPEADVTLGRVEIGGRKVVDGGQLVAADVEEVRANAREEAARLWSRMRTL